MAKIDPTICTKCGQSVRSPIHISGSSLQGAHAFERIKIGPIGRVPGLVKALPFIIILGMGLVWYFFARGP